MDFQTSNNVANQADGFTYREKHTHHHDIIERIILGCGSFLLSMLGLRFILALLAANPSNGFASFVYGSTHPLTVPFYNLFSYDHPAIGTSTFEGYTLVAMMVYSLVTAALVGLVGITRLHPNPNRTTKP